MEQLYTFTGKLNQDVTPILLPKEDHSNAINFDNSNGSDSSVGVGGRVRSSREAVNSYKDSDDVVVGTATYTKEDIDVVFVKNTSGYAHKILLVSKDNNVQQLMKDSNLRFGDDVDAKCYEDNVIFTDNKNEPRLINIPKMLNYSKQTQYSNNILYHFEEISGTEYTSVAFNITEYFIYEDVVYKMYLPAGTSSFTVVPPTTPLQSEYTVVQNFEDNTYYSNSINEYALIAKPPTKNPIISYVYDDSRKVNNLFGELFVVTYRYIYNDGRKSVWSPYSDISFPLGSISEDGYKLENSPNAIDITVEGGGRNLFGIDIAVKTLSNQAVFKLIATLRNEDGVLSLINGTTIRFFNDKTYTYVDANDVIRQFDYVPYKAKNISMLPDGQVLFSDFQEGYENVKTNVELELKDETIDIGVVAVPIVSKSITHNGKSIKHYTVNSTKGYQEGMVAKVVFNLSIDGVTLLFPLTAEIKGGVYSGNNNEKTLQFLRSISKGIRSEVIQHINFFAIHGSVDSDFTMPYSKREEALFTLIGDKVIFAGAAEDCTTIVSAATDRAYNMFIITDDTLGVITVDESGLQTTYDVKISVTSVGITEADDIELETVRSYSSYVIGMRYYGEYGRSSFVKEVGTLNTGFLDLGNISPTHLTIKRNKIEATINHTPPSWAKKYSMMVMDNKSYSYYLQMVAFNVGVVAPYTKMDINTQILNMKDANNNCVITPYTLEKGDRIRFIAKGNAKDDFTYEERFDKEILRQDDKFIYFEDVGSLLKSGDIVEIYRPRKNVEDEGSNLYYEIGELVDINRYGYHDGNIQSQTSALPAILDIKYKDAFITKRSTTDADTTPTVYRYFVENNNFSDFYESRFQRYSRIGISDDIKVDRGSSLRFGGKLLPETSNNFIGRFDWEDYSNLSTNYGRINGTEVVGDTINVFQDLKTTSFYINKTSLKKADGSDQVVLTDKVLNNKLVSEFDYGCNTKNSIIKRDTHVLFFDSINGAFVRHSKNGLIDISEYGITEWSKKLGQAVRDGVVDIVGEYDERTKLFWWLIKCSSTDSKYDFLRANGNRMAITFDDKTNQWKSFIEMKNTQYLGKLNSYLTAYTNGGKVFIFDDNGYGKVVGEDVETSVEKVANEAPTTTKVFNAMEISGDDQWLPYTDGDVKTANQQSMIRNSVKKEDNYYCPIKRNTLYPNGTSRPDENSGDAMRGDYLKLNLRLKSTTNDKSEIKWVKVSFTPSEKV